MMLRTGCHKWGGPDQVTEVTPWKALRAGHFWNANEPVLPPLRPLDARRSAFQRVTSVTRPHAHRTRARNISL